jgi:hypothetical protein
VVAGHRSRTDAGFFVREKASDRKLRLFAVACCHRVWPLLDDERSQEALRCAESFADGERDERDLAAVLDGAYEAHDAIDNPLAVGWAARKREAADAVYEAVAACYPDGYFGADEFKAKEAAGKAANAVPDRKAERKSQCTFLREIMGNPFRPVSFDPSWLTWHDGLLGSMARRMYDSRDFSDMPILADALEEAGCDNTDILAHCREPGEHVRGCWVVDLLLGKE